MSILQQKVARGYEPGMVCWRQEGNVRERDGLVDALRGVAILLVVVGHGVQYSLGLGYEQNFVFRAIYSFHMPLFFFISGHLFREQPSPKDNARKVGRKVLAFLGPYLFWTLLWHALSMVVREDAGTSVAWHSLWFFPVLAACLCIHTGVVSVMAGRSLTVKLAAGFFLALILYMVDSAGFWLSSIRYHYIFFLVGVLTQGWYGSLRFARVSVAVAGVVLWGMLLVWGQYDSSTRWLEPLNGSPYVQKVLGLCVRLVAAMLPVYCLCYLIGVLPPNLRKGLSYLGIHSLQIYVVHIGLAELLYRDCDAFGVLFWMVGTMMIAGAILITRAAEKSRYACLLLFGRRPSSPAPAHDLGVQAVA